MERFNFISMEIDNDCFYIQLKDNRNDFRFWIDCGLMDGYGNRENYKTEELFIDWQFNQYIFFNDNEHDIFAKQYQENIENTDDIGSFIDEHNDELIKKYQEKLKEML